ncbi:hypothetical protein ACFLRW_05080 [Acidobacteriota bacterium]
MNLSNNKKNTFFNKQIIDYDIHGIVGIRLLNPTKSDAVAVANQLGPNLKALDRDPDITIRFKDKLSTPTIKYVGLDAGFTDDGFYIFCSRENAKIRIPLEKVGSQCEIICESGLHGIPWLSEIINLTFLKKKHIPLHASAFEYNGTGTLVTGWTKGGKTEALLSFANHGANYVGDECVILSSDGKKMFGTHVPICIWEWQFKHIPDLLPKIGIQRKILFKSIHFLDFLHKSMERNNLRNSFPAKILNKALPSFKRQLNIRVKPEKIFENQYSHSASLDRLILGISHSNPEILIEKCDPSEIAKRMIHSNTNELLPFLEIYKAFKYAFPQLRNQFLENHEKHQYSLLCRIFENKKSYKVFHPYQVSFEDYFNELRPYCEKKTD